MRVTAYAYPWDLARLGVEPTLREMAAHGIEAIDLAATYHPIDSLSPRGAAVGVFTSARGAVHFPARASNYGRIQPKLSAPGVHGVWPEVARHARDIGLGLSAWTVTLFQPWIVDSYPDCAWPHTPRAKVKTLRARGQVEQAPTRDRSLEANRRSPLR